MAQTSMDLDKLQNHIKALKNGDEISRRQAIQSLKGHEKEWADAPRKVIDPLVEALRHQLLNGMKQAPLRQEVVAILGHMGRRSESAIPQLLELLQDGQPESIREAAATALGNIGAANQKVRAALSTLWLSPSLSQNNKVRVAIALCKLKCDDRSVLRFLTIVLVSHQDASLRHAAAEALACCHKDEVDVVPALLMAVLNEKDEDGRQIAQASLKQLRLSNEKAIQLCARQLKDSSFAEAALRNSGQLAVPALIEALQAEDLTVREKATRLLGRLGELAAKAVPELTTALHDRNADLRLATAKSLWNITKNAELAVPVLIDLLRGKWAAALVDTESRRRFLQTVIEALQRIGPPAKAAVSALNEKARDKNRLVSESALRALEEIAPAVATRPAR